MNEQAKAKMNNYERVGGMDVLVMRCACNANVTSRSISGSGFSGSDAVDESPTSMPLLSSGLPPSPPPLPPRDNPRA